MTDRQRRTKILATLGPATDPPGVLDELFRAGVNVVRLNFSHGDPSGQAKRAAEVVGSSWQAAVSITGPEPTYGYLRALGEELRCVLMVSKVSVSEGEALSIVVDKAEGE